MGLKIKTKQILRGAKKLTRHMSPDQRTKYAQFLLRKRGKGEGSSVKRGYRSAGHCK